MTTTAPPAPATGPDAALRRAIDAIAAGGVVIVVDDANREPRGALVASAELATPATLAFLATHGRGLLCVAVLRERLRDIGIPPMHGTTADQSSSAFHV